MALADGLHEIVESDFVRGVTAIAVGPAGRTRTGTVVSTLRPPSLTTTGTLTTPENVFVGVTTTRVPSMCTAATPGIRTSPFTATVAPAGTPPSELCVVFPATVVVGTVVGAGSGAAVTPNDCRESAARDHWPLRGCRARIVQTPVPTTVTIPCAETAQTSGVALA